MQPVSSRAPLRARPLFSVALALCLPACGTDDTNCETMPCSGAEEGREEEEVPGEPESSAARRAERPDAPPFGARGALAVGYRTFEYAGADRTKPLGIKAWYPAQRAANESESIDYEVRMKRPDWESFDPPVIRGRALRDAPIAEAEQPYPLVVFSHGYSINPEWYGELVEHYASRGFVVLAPEHDESDWFEAGAALFARPLDVRHTLDFAESDADDARALLALVDTTKVAVLGHSFGGYTALAVAGARFDFAALAERCGALDAEDPKAFLCAPFVGQERELAELAGYDEVPAGLWPSLRDERVKVIVPMAGDAYLFDEMGLAGVEVPMMAMGGTEDFGTPWAWGAELAYEHARSATKFLVGLEGANHMISANSCETMPWAPLIDPFEYSVICLEPVWDKARAHDVLEHYSTAFLLDALNGDEDARAALTSAPPLGVRFSSSLE